MIFGTKKIKEYLENVDETEPVALIVGKNPMSFYTIRTFVNRCRNSGRLSEGEVAILEQEQSKFELYPNKEASLTYPVEMVNQAESGFSTKKVDKPNDDDDDDIPVEKPIDSDDNDNPIIEGFAEDRKANESSKEESSEEESDADADAAIDSLKK